MCFINIILIFNLGQSTLPATKKKINSIPVHTGTHSEVLSATFWGYLFYLTSLHSQGAMCILKKRIDWGKQWEEKDDSNLLLLLSALCSQN